MTDKPSPPFRIAPLRRIAAEPITDPAEQAALDEQRKRPAEGRPSVRVRGGVPRPANLTAPEVLELVRQLPAEDQYLLATQLAAQLSPDERRELTEQLVGQLPADALQRLEQMLRGRLGGR